MSCEDYEIDHDFLSAIERKRNLLEDCMAVSIGGIRKLTPDHMAQLVDAITVILRDLQRDFVKKGPTPLQVKKAVNILSLSYDLKVSVRRGDGKKDSKPDIQKPVDKKELNKEKR